ATPRALSGVGLLVVLGLGTFLLPLRPTWAQVEDPRARRDSREAEEQRLVIEQRLAQAEEARQQEPQPREEQRSRFDAERYNERYKMMAERQRLAAEVEHMR